MVSDDSSIALDTPNSTASFDPVADQCSRMKEIAHLHIEGFRSIRSADIPLRPLNVLIGANGAGKSNLIDLFRLLNYALSGGFQDPYLLERGPASAILHYGPKVTGVIRVELTFHTELGTNWYRFTLADTAGDRLTFTKEEVQFQRKDSPTPSPSVPLIGHPSDNSGLAELWSENDPTARFAKGFLQRCRVYQFHDTSLTSHLRDYSPTDRNRYLYADGGNLSAVLWSLRTEAPDSYLSIIRTLRLILPWFDDFLLEPEGRKGVLLRWRMAGRADISFGPGHLSDGSLRIMALVTLLLLPPEQRPDVIILDEPELGLHPAAIGILVQLLRGATATSQVIVATQSVTLVNQVAPEDVVVVEQEDGQSTFRRCDAVALQAWLKEFSLGELWEKNVLGGQP